MFHYGNCREEWRIKQLELNVPLRSSPYKHKALLTERAGRFKKQRILEDLTYQPINSPTSRCCNMLHVQSSWNNNKKQPKHLVITMKHSTPHPLVWFAILFESNQARWHASARNKWWHFDGWLPREAHGSSWRDPLFSCMSVLLEPTVWFMMCHGLFLEMMQNVHWMKPDNSVASHHHFLFYPRTAVRLKKNPNTRPPTTFPGWNWLKDLLSLWYAVFC